MQLNENTVSVLKNFANIQPNLVVNEGNLVKTIAEAKNIFGTATLDQSFPNSFGIYDLNEFLGVIGLVDNPSLVFGDKYVTISDSTGRSSVKYHFSDPSILTSSDRDIPMPESEVNFELDAATLNKILRAASTLGHEKMVISPKDGALDISVTDVNDSTSNSFSITVPGNYSSDNFSVVMNISNLKLLEDDYSVEISSKLLSRFTAKNKKVSYFIAMEKSSTFN